MKKSTKRFTLTTDAVNGYGFRVVTAGIDLTQFKRNSLMLWMHGRAVGGDRNQILPLGYWDELEHTNTNITGVPVFDDTDDFALSVYNKVENGTLKMASAGLKPVEWEGEAFASNCKRSIMQEASIVDIGANDDALGVALYNHNGGIIHLSNIGGAAVGGVITDPYILRLAAKSWTELDKQGGLAKLKAAAPDLFAKKFNEQFGHYPKGYQGSTNLSLNSVNHSPYVLQLYAKPYNELDHSDGLQQLKNLAPDLFRAKFYEQYGKYPAGMETPANATLTAPASPVLNLSQILELDAKSWAELDRAGELPKLKLAAPELFRTKFLKQFGKPYTNN